MGSDATVITTMAGVIAALASFISWFFKDSLNRAEERLARMEDREDTLLKDLSATVAQVAATAASMYELVKTVAEVTHEQQIEKRLREQQQVEKRGREQHREATP